MNINKLTNVINNIVYLVFFIIVCRKLGMSGTGIFASTFVLFYVLFVIFNGSSRSSISKMVSTRLKRGFNDNAKKVFRYALLMTFFVSVAVLVLFLFLNSFICDLLYKETLGGGILAFLGILFLVAGLSETIKGYYLGCGGHVLMIIGDIAKDIALIASTPFIIDAFMMYGTKVAALKNDDILIGAYGAMGASVSLIIGFLVLLITLLIGVRGLVRNENYSFNEVRSKDGFNTFLRSYFPLVIRKIRDNIFPALPVLVAGCVFFRSNIIKDVSREQVYSDIACFYGLFFIIVIFATSVMKEYCITQYSKIRSDYKKEDRKGVLSKYNAFLKSLLTVAMPIVITLITFSGYVCKNLILFDIDGITKIAVVLGFSLLLAFVDIAFTTGLEAVNLDITVLLGNIVALAVEILFVLLRSKSYLKIQSTGTALLLFYLICVIVHGVFAVKNIGVKFNDFLAKLIKVSIAFLPMLLLDFILVKFVKMNVIIALLCAVIGYIVYSIVLFAIRGMNQKDINNIQGTILYYLFSVLGSIFHVR